jgi:hypothetical protein
VVFEVKMHPWASYPIGMKSKRDKLIRRNNRPKRKVGTVHSPFQRMPKKRSIGGSEADLKLCQEELRCYGLLHISKHPPAKSVDPWVSNTQTHIWHNYRLCLRALIIDCNGEYISTPLSEVMIMLLLLLPLLV